MPLAFSQSTDQLIADIQKQCKAIDIFTKTADFQSMHFQDESSRESELMIYRDGQRPIKLSVAHVFSTGKEEKVFYFDEMGLIYIEVFQTTFQRIPRWEEAKSNELGEVERRDASTVKVEKNYFYFKSWKLIEWLAPKSKAEKEDSFQRKEIELVEEARVLIRRLK